MSKVISKGGLSSGTTCTYYTSCATGEILHLISDTWKLRERVIQLVKLVREQECVQVEILALNLQYTKLKSALKSKISSYNSYLDFYVLMTVSFSIVANYKYTCTCVRQ